MNTIPCSVPSIAYTLVRSTRTVWRHDRDRWWPAWACVDAARARWPRHLCRPWSSWQCVPSCAPINTHCRSRCRSLYTHCAAHSSSHLWLQRYVNMTITSDNMVHLMAFVKSGRLQDYTTCGVVPVAAVLVYVFSLARHFIVKHVNIFIVVCS